MKFEGPPQFNSEQPAEKATKPEIEVESEQKILERAARTYETGQVTIEKPSEKIETKKDQEPTHEEIEEHKEQLHEPIVEKEKVSQKVIVNRQDIKRVGKQLRELLRGDISIEKLSVFAKQLGIEHTIKTPLLRIAGANGLTQELSDGSAVILYHGILPGTDKYYLSHEIAHSLLGHLTVERKGIKQGLKEEWDADTFASSVTHLPQPLALLYCHIVDGFIGKLYKLVGPLIKKREVKRISDIMGYYPDELKDAFK